MADYAISNVPRRVVYAASGVGPYAFTFEILNQTDIAVYKASTLLTLTTDYTVTINANGTGSVTLVATAGTSNITIVGAKNIQRTTDFTTGGDLFANTLNDELDNQTIFIQQVAETAERGLKAPVVDPTDINMTLPAKASRVGTVLAFNATTGNPEAGPSIGSVTTVAAQSANINTVAANIASVNTVAGNIVDVNTVAGISSDVTMVATFQYNVNTVADDLNEPTSEINTVAVDIANVNAVGTNISNVNTVAGNNANVTTVAGISGNVTTVAGVAANVTTVAGVAANVTTVAGVAADVTTVAGVAGNVTTVANNSANVTTVAGSIANVNNVGNNISNVNLNAANIVAIQNAADNAIQAQLSESAAVIAASAASASAAAASAVALGNEPVRHSVRPSLLLDFANTKTLDPRITYTRASTGTYYDGKTVAKAEENLLTDSEVFTNWGNTNASVTSNSTTAPNATTTADTLTGVDNASVNHRTEKNATTSPSLPYTFSVYAKANTSNFVIVGMQGDSFGSSSASSWVATTVNLSDGTKVNSAGATAVEYSTAVTSVGSGWYRISVTATTDASAASSSVFRIALSDTATPAIGNFLLYSYTNGTSSSVYLWGAQLEQRSTVTAYTPTTTAPITNYVPVLLSAPANVARFEHNPVTGESLGLEIEEQRTNLLRMSEDFTNSVWAKDGAVSITSNTFVSPDGTITGDLVNSPGFNQTISQQFTASSTSHVFTIYLRAGYTTTSSWYWGTSPASPITGSGITCSILSGTGTATVSGAQMIFTNLSTTSWTKVQCTITGLTVSTNYSITSYIGASSGGALVGNIGMWGAQLEAGAFATSYIPTTVSQVTRSADSASMTGTNFSSWYNTSQGTVYYQYDTVSLTTSRTVGELSDGTSNNRYLWQSNPGGSARNLTFINGSAVVALDTTAALSAKWASAYSIGSYASSYNGNTALTSSYAGVAPNINQLILGHTIGGGAQQLNGTIKKLAYYPKRLTNAEIQSLTVI